MTGRSARLSLVFSCLGHAYVHLFTAFYFVVVLALEADWRLPYHELVELWTLGALLVGVGALPAGWIGDRWSASGMMVVYFLGMGGASLACALVDGPRALLLGLATIGLFASIYHPVGIAWLVRSASRRGKALGINGVFGSIGIAGAGLVAGSLIDTFGWRSAFLVPGLVSIATGAALLGCKLSGLVTDDAAAPRGERPVGRAEMLRGFIVLLFTMLCMGVIFQAIQAALPKLFDLRLRDLAGDGLFGIGVAVALVYGVGGLMQVIGGHLADRYPLKPVYLGAFLLQVPVLSALAAFSGLPLVAASVLAVTLSVAALPAENMLLTRYTPERHRSLAFGIKFVLAFGTAPLAIELVAAIQERSGEFVWLFLLLAALALACLLAAAALPGQPRAQRPAAAPAE